MCCSESSSQELNLFEWSSPAYCDSRLIDSKIDRPQTQLCCDIMQRLTLKLENQNYVKLIFIINVSTKSQHKRVDYFKDRSYRRSSVLRWWGTPRSPSRNRWKPLNMFPGWVGKLQRQSMKTCKMFSLTLSEQNMNKMLFVILTLSPVWIWCAAAFI